MSGHVDVDVCVVGAGLAGAATSLHLARQGLRVALVDRSRSGHPSADATEVLPPAAVHALGALGVHEAAALGSACRGVLSRWQSEAVAFTDYELLGCSPGRAVIRWTVARCLSAHATHAGVQVMAIGRLRAERAGRRWMLVPGSDTGQPRVSCSHLIDATGRSGRPIAPLPPRCHHDRAVCLSVRHPAAMRDPSLLLVDRSTHGWWYAIGSGEGATDVALVTDADLLPPAPVRTAWIAAAYREAGLIASALDTPPDFAAVHARDARSGHRASAAGSGWLAVGDAALAWDPLSGYGMRFALQSAARATGAIVHEDASLGYPDYARWIEEATAEYQRARATAYDGVTAHRSSAFWRRRVPGRAVLCPAP